MFDLSGENDTEYRSHGCKGMSVLQLSSHICSKWHTDFLFYFFISMFTSQTQRILNPVIGIIKKVHFKFNVSPCQENCPAFQAIIQPQGFESHKWKDITFVYLI